MTLKDSLSKRPVIYEIVPPRKDTSRYQSELKGVEDVLHDGRIDALNIPELMRRREGKHVRYVPVTIPPEDYALMVKEYKEAVVNIIAPRLPKEEFLRRARRIMNDYRIPNMVLVGKERHEDALPGPGVAEALRLLRPEKGGQALLGGICIFNRESVKATDYGAEDRVLTEARRVLEKSKAGCDFVTSQITLDPAPAVKFLSSYEELCGASGADPVTVFISLATIPTPSILALIESLDVVVPPQVKKRLSHADSMGRTSIDISAEVLQEVLSELDRRNVRVPLGVQVEQIGVNNDELSLELLDRVYPFLRRN